jgi:hypothetical protein
MSAGHSWAVLRPYWSCASSEERRGRQLPARLREPSLKKRGRSGGGNRIALGAAGKPALRSWRAGVTQPGPTSPAAWQWHGARSDGRALR